MLAPRNPDTRRGLHLIARARSEDHPNTRLTLGDYIADVLIGKDNHPCCHYILQRVGSAEIIDMQQFDTFAEAEQAAKQALQDWHHRQSKVS